MRELERARFGSLFATPLLSHVWADSSELNPQLRESNLEHAHRNPGKTRTNVGGWHSEPGMLEFCGGAGQRLIRRMNDMIEEATLRLYAEFSRPPQPTNWIFSAGGTSTGVAISTRCTRTRAPPGRAFYYVDHGESSPEADGTAIRLYDPYPARTNIFFPELSTSNVLFKPEPGSMILFPIYVPHAVLPHRGDRKRISVALNVRREPVP